MKTAWRLTTADNMRLVLTIFVVALCHYGLANQEEVLDESDLFEGDMELSPDQKEELDLQAAGLPTYGVTHGRNYPKWPTVIPYEISAELAKEAKAVQAINDAIAQYHKYSCLRFRKKKRTDQNYFKFINPPTNKGCSSPVAMQGVNGIRLASGCWDKGTIMHEMLHSLGFFHEQSRPDRDNYITIVWANIPSKYPNDKRHNFRKYKADRINSLGSPYDLDSLMHYGRTDFGDGKVTIRTKDTKYSCRIGQREGFSQEDVTQLNKKYCGGRRVILPKRACVDKSDKDDCDYFKTRGLCTCGNKYYKFMMRECRKTCGCP